MKIFFLFRRVAASSNKSCYLMVAGGMHHGIQVRGLVKTVAEEIVYLALLIPV